MTGMRQLDVLVIGLGPAGATAAAAAARRGLSVMAVDRRREPGLPVQCAEYIPLTIASYANPADIRVQTVARMTSRIMASPALHSEVPGLMIDRARFDRKLVHDAGQAGAELATGTRLRGLCPRRQQATLQQANEIFEVAYRYLVAADGPHSMVARQLGLPELETIYSYQISVSLTDTMQDTEVWLDGRFPGGYAWLFPRGEEANLGVAGYRHQAGPLKQALYGLHQQLLDEGRVGARVHRATGGPIPVGGLRASLLTGRHLFVGDAAGLCHPITGAGIANAVQSGRAAGEAIAAHAIDGEVDALQDYDSETQWQYGPSLAHAAGRRRELQARWRDGEYEADDHLRRSWIACTEYFQGRDNVECP